MDIIEDPVDKVEGSEDEDGGADMALLTAGLFCLSLIHSLAYGCVKANLKEEPCSTKAFCRPVECVVFGPHCLQWTWMTPLIIERP